MGGGACAAKKLREGVFIGSQEGRVMPCSTPPLGQPCPISPYPMGHIGFGQRGLAALVMLTQAATCVLIGPIDYFQQDP